ncbi:MAG: hypothetical protein IJ506_01690 [Clostridia bacterium]|nr:hypothetical protein [Clostridia bacterium]
MERAKVKKLETYLGFCIRAGKITFGVDGIESLKKGVKLLLADEGLGESSFKTMQKLREKFECPLIVLACGELGERLHRPAVKAVAIKDKNLADAILSVADGEPQFKIYSGGNN